MKAESFVRQALSALVCALLIGAAAWGRSPAQAKDQPKISDGEQQALNKINSAPDVPAKLKAAGDYLKKYGKSPMRPKVAIHVAENIERTADHAQRVAQARQFVSTFNQPDEAWYVEVALVESLLAQNKVDEAFQEGAKYLEKQPEDLRVMTPLAVAGLNQLQQQNQKYVQQTKDYSSRALALIEGDRRPERMEKEFWDKYRNHALPRLYQVQGLFALFTNDRETAKARLENAAGLDQSDPVTFAALGQIYDDEYRAVAKEYQAAPPGLRDELLKKANEKIDQVIEYYARAIAAAEGKAQFQPMQQQLMQALEAYYSFRHDGKADGLKAYIEKFKKPSP
ncbi:MAG TPA: hypothetical protein VNQ79_04745 [Blastocatellia bacterium]|nr:hypothetical protein [Blastocatellia bacterium]